MSNKVKHWHVRKPKHGDKENKPKRIASFRHGNDRVDLHQSDDWDSPEIIVTFEEDEYWES